MHIVSQKSFSIQVTSLLNTVPQIYVWKFNLGLYYSTLKYKTENFFLLENMFQRYVVIKSLILTLQLWSCLQNFAIKLPLIKTYLEEFYLFQGISDVVFLFEPISVFEQNFNSIVIISFCRIDHGTVVRFRASYDCGWLTLIQCKIKITLYIFTFASWNMFYRKSCLHNLDLGCRICFYGWIFCSCYSESTWGWLSKFLSAAALWHGEWRHRWARWCRWVSWSSCHCGGTPAVLWQFARPPALSCWWSPLLWVRLHAFWSHHWRSEKTLLIGKENKPLIWLSLF